MIKAILMDFNGVVIDDEPIQHSIYKEILAADGIEVSDEEYYSRLGMDDKTFVASFLTAAGKGADIDRVLELTSLKTQKWREAIEADVPLFPGIENFIRKMANDFALGIVSMSKREEIDFVLEKTGLADRFSAFVCAEDVGECKPDPECYRKGFEMIDLSRIAQGHLPMTHSECLVIEDSPPGVAAGKAADLPVLGVANTVSADDLRKAGADWVATNLDDWFPASIRQTFSAKV
ncbi:MAG TPA: HAD family phosphatase [Pyrinomonadaceae bacterium]|nr:HAD family phosphatase [Pyrinomonadaceae bacterium]